MAQSAREKQKATRVVTPVRREIPADAGAANDAPRVPGRLTTIMARPRPIDPALSKKRRKIDDAVRGQVYFVKHKRKNGRGTYTALASPRTDSHAEKTEDTTAEQIPEITIHEGWLYVVGDAPCVGTKAVIAQAEGCALLLQIYPESNKTYHRIYYLEGTTNQVVWLHKMPYNSQVREMGMLTVGTYVDAEVDSTGNFKNWRGRADNEDPEIKPLDEKDPIYATISGAVQEQREQNQV